MCDPQITSIEDLLRIVDSWAQRFRFKGEIGFPAIWFRGQSRFDWRLDPGILREDFVNIAKKICPNLAEELAVLSLEVGLNRRFHSMAASLLPNGCSLTHIYFLAQHHGFRTRLLDWTTHPLAALYFSVASKSDVDWDGAIYIMNPHRLIPPPELQKRLLYSSLSPRDSYLRQRIEPLFDLRFDNSVPSKDLFIIPVLPDHHAGRLHQQGSCFTFHGTGAASLEESIGQPWLDKYIIPRSSKAHLLQALRRLNVTRASLFHDLDNICADIIGAFGL